jgi:hypothetical protein
MTYDESRKRLWYPSNCEALKSCGKTNIAANGVRQHGLVHTAPRARSDL